MALDDEVDDESVLTIEKYREDEHGQPLTKDGACSQMDDGSSSFLSTEKMRYIHLDYLNLYFLIPGGLSQLLHVFLDII